LIGTSFNDYIDEILSISINPFTFVLVGKDKIPNISVS